jgi:hypothetical protein
MVGELDGDGGRSRRMNGGRRPSGLRWMGMAAVGAMMDEDGGHRGCGGWGRRSMG